MITKIHLNSSASLSAIPSPQSSSPDTLCIGLAASRTANCNGMSIHTVTIEDDGSSYRCVESQTLLEGMESLGNRGIPVGCRGGGCGVCKIQVLSGTYTKRVMSREHISATEEANGCVLACRVKPTSALVLRVIGQMKKNVCRAVEPAGALSLST